MSTASSGSLALQRVKLGYALEIRDGIVFEFYLGLPHIALRAIKVINNFYEIAM